MPNKRLDDWPPHDEAFKELSDVKKLILQILWPMKWVSTHEIHRIAKQSYYDRRIRELRESGWQIEFVYPNYRLKSRKKLPGSRRQYPSAKQKQEVYLRDKGICQICGTTHPRMEYDHKIPMERLGTTEVMNLQLLCSPCNVDKRGACKKCKLLTCDGCPYAYPELYKGRFVVLADEKVAEEVKADAERQGLSQSAFILNILHRHYSGKD
ncbi:MAG: HNH endonuclease [Chloroflexota bacterium]